MINQLPMVRSNPYIFFHLVNVVIYQSLTSLLNSGEVDTAPGYHDSNGAIIGAGMGWRHKKVCPDSGCFSQPLIYRDNCRIRRYAVLDSFTGLMQLSPCTYPENGSSAYDNIGLEENGPTFNETSYFNQFSANLTRYSWYGSVDNFAAEDFIHRNFLIHQEGYGADNITSYFFSKQSVSFNSESAVSYTVSIIIVCSRIGLLCMCTPG